MQWCQTRTALSPVTFGLAGRTYTCTYVCTHTHRHKSTQKLLFRLSSVCQLNNKTRSDPSIPPLSPRTTSCSPPPSLSPLSSPLSLHLLHSPPQNVCQASLFLVPVPSSNHLFIPCSSLWISFVLLLSRSPTSPIFHLFPCNSVQSLHLPFPP